VSSHAKTVILCDSLDFRIGVKSPLERCTCSCLYAARLIILIHLTCVAAKIPTAKISNGLEVYLDTIFSKISQNFKSLIEDKKLRSK
jgi:hypothetical protein